MSLHNCIAPKRAHPLPKSVLLEDEEDEQAMNPDNRDLHGDPPGTFQYGIWLLLVLEVWVLDFGRPIFGMFVMRSMPLSALSIGEFPRHECCSVSPSLSLILYAYWRIASREYSLGLTSSMTL